jgi:hypothetical protein
MGNRSSCRGGGVLTSCLPSHTKKEDLLLREEREREEGQALLRSMVEANHEVDWAAVIAKAQELHKREQALVQKRRRKESLRSRHKNRRDLARRRRKDAVGSFSVNMLTYRQDGTVPDSASVSDGPSVGTSDRSSAGTRQTGDTIAGDTSSLNSYYSSSSLVDFANISSWDEEGMAPIDETNVLY